MTSIKKRTAVDWDTVKTLYPFSNSLQLTKEQRVSLASMTGHQMSAMHFHSKAMENARNLLRKMAKNNHYDKSAAKTAASTIANSHASLSMLQVEREYQLHLLLNDSQARQYKEMKSKGQLTID